MKVLNTDTKGNFFACLAEQDNQLALAVIPLIVLSRFKSESKRCAIALQKCTGKLTHFWQRRVSAGGAE